MGKVCAHTEITPRVTMGVIEKTREKDIQGEGNIWRKRAKIGSGSTFFPLFSPPRFLITVLMRVYYQDVIFSSDILFSNYLVQSWVLSRYSANTFWMEWHQDACTVNEKRCGRLRGEYEAGRPLKVNLSIFMDGWKERPKSEMKCTPVPYPPYDIWLILLKTENIGCQTGSPNSDFGGYVLGVCGCMWFHFRLWLSQTAQKTAFGL